LEFELAGPRAKLDNRAMASDARRLCFVVGTSLLGCASKPTQPPDDINVNVAHSPDPEPERNINVAAHDPDAEPDEAPEDEAPPADNVNVGPMDPPEKAPEPKHVNTRPND